MSTHVSLKVAWSGKSLIIKTELLIDVITMFIIQLYLNQKACNVALNKCLFSAAANHWIMQLLLDATFKQSCSTAYATYIENMLRSNRVAMHTSAENGQV